jgi:hypothetical protein
MAYYLPVIKNLEEPVSPSCVAGLLNVEKHLH